MRVRGLIRATTAACLLGLVAADHADARTNRALIVAVTAYPNLQPSMSLVGPNHDATLVRTYLTTESPVRFEPANVVVLADGIDSAGSPTRAAIEAQLAALAEKAQGGDFIYIHYSGHGSQQPAADPASEPDGKDEILLPADVSTWDQSGRSVPNALADDQIGKALDAIRAKGAFVWLVTDACNSGTVTRAVRTLDGERDRKLEPADLGIPADAIQKAEVAAASNGEATRGGAASVREGRLLPKDGVEKGGMVAFFAAQTVESTPELAQPAGEPGADVYGLFTYTLFSTLAANPSITYRQLAQTVLQSYSAENRLRPTPLFEGELDAPVFATEPGEVIQQWKIAVTPSKTTIPAGMLHRLTPGSVLAVLPSPTATDEDALGYLEVAASKALESSLTPVAYDGKPAIAPRDIPAGAFARVADLAIDFRLKVARPAETASNAAAVAAANAVLDAIAADTTTPVNIELLPPGQTADLVLAVFPERDVPGARSDAGAEQRLWFLPSTGEIGPDQLYVAAEDEEGEPADLSTTLALREKGSRSRGVAIPDSNDDDFARIVRRNLVAVYRATNLARLTAASTFGEKDLAVKLEAKRADGSLHTVIEPGVVPVLDAGDEVHLDLKNTTSTPIDVNALWIGTDYSIIWGGGERIQPDDHLRLPLFAVTPAASGLERLVLVTTEARPQTAVEQLDFLEQEGIKSGTRAAGGTRGDMASLLESLGDGSATRGVKALGLKKNAQPKSGITMYMIETRPAPGETP